MALIQTLCCWLKQCPKCGLTYGHKDYFCENCWELFYFNNSSKNINVGGYSFKLKSLFKWNEEVKNLVLNLKNGKNHLVFERLAYKFIQQNINLKENYLFIPCPSKTGKKDHAYFWAEALSKIWRKTPFLCLNYKEKDLVQKLKNRMERSHIGFEKIKKLPINPYIVFLDDVVTTGFTAKAAFIALGKPKNFEIWSITWKPYEKML